jgi:hypothetical protein
MSARRSSVGASVCSFTFADGRRCRTPRCKDHPFLGYFQAQKEAQASARQKIAHDIGTWLIGDDVSAGDLATAIGLVIAFTAPGKISCKTVTTVGYLSQTLIQAIKLSPHEYINAGGADQWRRVIRCGTTPLPLLLFPNRHPLQPPPPLRTRIPRKPPQSLPLRKPRPIPNEEVDFSPALAVSGRHS